MGEDNLKVKDAEHSGFADAIGKAGTVAEGQIEDYFAILDAVLEAAITAGDVYENLRLFQGQAQALKGVVDGLCAAASSEDASYLCEIDAKDEYLY